MKDFKFYGITYKKVGDISSIEITGVAAVVVIFAVTFAVIKLVEWLV